MNEKIFQGIIYVLLILMLMMCGIFFWGAYYNHYVTLNKIGNKSISILNKVTENDVEAVESRIERLKNIQKNLFDTNTISFFYNLFMIIIVTIGGYILSTIKSSERKAQSNYSIFGGTIALFMTTFISDPDFSTLWDCFMKSVVTFLCVMIKENVMISLWK